MFNSRNIIVLSCLFLNSFSFTQGVRCWTCENAISNDDCIDRGRSVECFGDGIGCSSEVRYHAGFVFKIQVRKGCKQILACGSDKSQNGHGWYPVQCNPKYPDSICRCCCQTDDCNRNLIGCEPPQPDCRKLKVPNDGSIKCNSEGDGTALRTICIFRCDKGYELRGSYKTQCFLNKEREGEWTSEEPRCTTKKCKPLYRDTLERRVKCTRKNHADSVCTFSCAAGYVMNGLPQSTCLNSKNWDYPPPECVKITCPPPKNPPAYSEMTCSDGLEYGSVCEYTCLPGYMIVGDSRSECVLSSSSITAFGVWSGTLPKCAAIMCELKQTNPQFGQVGCTDMNYSGSTCSFICKEGYRLDGFPITTCEFNSETSTTAWTSEAPVCTKIVCEVINTGDSNGHVSCSNSNNVGSVCAFACNEGAYLKSITKRVMTINQLTLSCRGDGSWSEELATCSVIKCYPEMSAMQNGNYQCTDSNNYKSFCQFSCDDGYELKGSKRSVCRDGRSLELPGIWSEQQPRCIRIGCTRQPKSDGDMRVSCNNRYLFGSVCTFSCRRGYYMTSPSSNYIEKNDYSTECTEDSDWTEPTPVCKQIRCLPDLGKLENGIVRCTNRNYHRTRCTFSCNVGYGLVGSSQSSCSDDTVTAGVGVWTNAKPKCVRNGCAPMFFAPVNGKIACTKQNLFHSTCTFTCREGFYMASFDNYLIEAKIVKSRCLTIGEWSQLPPTCHAITCGALARIDRGTISCTDGVQYKSKCTYVCDEGYEVNKATDTIECTGKLTSNAFGRWTEEGVKCLRATCAVRQRAPTDGKVACSSGNGVGSECLFECYDGHYMNTTLGSIISKNSLRTRCEKNKKWTIDAPRCLPVNCPKRRFPNGDVSCSRENRYLSQCKFSCMPGYMLVGTNVTTCRDDGSGDENGVWVKKWPECRELGCDPDLVHAPDNGVMLCSDAARLRSTCEYICDDGYEIDGDEFAVCRRVSEKLITWSSPVPKCLPIK